MVVLEDLTLFWISIAVVFAFIAFFYMLARIMRKTEWEAMAKIELRQVFVSIVIALGVFALAAMFQELSGIAMRDIVKVDKDWFVYSENYMKLLIGIGTETMIQFWTLSFMLKYAALEATQWYGVPVLARMIPATIIGVKEVIGATLGVLDMLFSFFVGSLHAQLVALQLFKAIAFTLVLPAGVILRAIPLTRSGGSFLIALAFGMFIVFPFTYVVNCEISKTVWPALFESLEHPSTPLEVAFPSLSGTFSTLFNLLDRFTLILPQSTILMMFSFTMTISFVNIFAGFINELE